MLLAVLLLQAVAPPLPTPCYRVEKQGSTTVMTYLGDRACINLEQPRIYEGIWIDEFEGQKFV